MSNTIDTYPVYSANTSISDFFLSHPGVSQEECDLLAKSLLESPVTPVPIQGVFSYTVFGGSPVRLIQFRSPVSRLDTDLLRLARSVHGDLVASTIYHGSIGPSPPLSIYVIEKLPGITYMEYSIADDMNTVLSTETTNRLEITIMSLARYDRPSHIPPKMLQLRMIAVSLPHP